MNLLQAILLGVVQGLTEFLPISSSGHLVIAGKLLETGTQAGGPVREVVAHLGTLLAVFLFFRRPLGRLISYGMAGGWLATRRQGLRAAWWEAPDGRLIVCIAAATIPTGLIGVGFQKTLEEAFQSPHAAGAGLLATSALLALALWRRDKGRNDRSIGLWIALGVGIAQGVAILPGVSRSGATIVAGLLMGLRREQAFEFSFLASIPAILGASVLELAGAPWAGSWLGSAPFVALAAAAFAAGWAALSALRPLVSRGQIGWFALYCLPLGLFALLAL